MPTAELWRWIGVATAIAAILIGSISLLSRRGSAAAAIPLGFFAAGTGLIVLLSGNQNLGLLTLSLALMVLGIFVAALMSSAKTLQRGPVIVCIALLTGLLAYGYYDPGVITSTELALLLAGPLLAWIAEAPPMRGWKTWKRELVRAALAGIPIAIAIGLAVVQFKKDYAASAGME